MAADRGAGRSGRSGDFPYFRTLRNKVVGALLAAAFLPMLLMGGTAYFYSASAAGPEILKAGLAALLLSALLIVPTVVFITNHLFRRLEEKRTDLRFLDQQLRHASQMASAGKLAQGALEDITDSLANIHAASQWLRELMTEGRPQEIEPDEIPGTLDQIDAEVHRSEKAVRRGLELSRPAAGPVPVEVNVGNLVSELLDHLRRELHFKRVSVDRAGIDPAATITTDPDGLRQLLQNLVTNAVEASEAGGEIRIAARAEAGRLRLTVTDSGPGIPAKDLERIFEPLYTTRPEGLGLGLAISRSIAAKLGGTLLARNVAAPGRGAVFTLELPV
jgi:signal transduction histidine kinase